MTNQTIKTLLTLKSEEQALTVTGWIRTKRESKSFCFIELNDGSCMKNLQVIIDQTLEGYEDLILSLTTGSSVGIEGKLMASPGGEQAVELHATQVTLYGGADADSYPLQKKRHSFEFLREIAHLRTRTNTLGAVMRVRNTLSMAVHRFFQENGFLYVQTPIITTSDCEGAGQMFQVTTLPLDNVPKAEGKVDFAKDFFGKATALTVSGQLEGEALAMAMGKIYTFGPTFRAEHSSTTRHLAEFWMIEPEMAFCDIHQDMDTAEAFLKYIFKHVLDNCQEDMVFFNKWIDKEILGSLETIVKEEFARITYTEAMDLLEKAEVAFEFPPSWGIDIQAEHEKYLTEKIFKKPVMITDYPKQIKAFYMKANEDGKTVRAMDVIVPRLGEIIGGSEREADLDTLVERMKAQNLNPEEYSWYLDLRRFGSAPHAGFGLGFERIIQFVTGMQNIRDVIPFPRAYRSAGF